MSTTYALLTDNKIGKIIQGSLGSEKLQCRIDGVIKTIYPEEVVVADSNSAVIAQHHSARVVERMHFER